jgi:hypothetical protein
MILFITHHAVMPLYTCLTRRRFNDIPQTIRAQARSYAKLEHIHHQADLPTTHSFFFPHNGHYGFIHFKLLGQYEALERLKTSHDLTAASVTFVLVMGKSSGASREKKNPKRQGLHNGGRSLG